MKTKLFAFLSAAVLGAAIALPTPAMAFRGGFGGGGFGGGMHGGFGGGGMHFGGGGFSGTHFGGGFHRPMFSGRSVFVPGGGRFAATPFAGRHFFGSRFNNFAGQNHFFFHHHAFFFRHHRFRNFAFFGVPFAVGAAYGDYCWRQAWTSYGWQWVNVCNDYGNYGY